MNKEKITLTNPNAKLRKAMAIVLYVFFMIWIIYSNHKKSEKTSPSTERLGQTSLNRR